MTLLEVLRRATGFLEQHGSSSPRLDAEVLLAHALRIRRLDLYLQFERPLSDAELGPYRELVARRGKGEPVAYLTGGKEFMGLRFEVGVDVLVPNPDTELLVQRAVAWARERGGRVRVADVGTGSGCISVSIAKFVPDAILIATDLSAPALEVARRNAAANGVGDRIQFIEGDLAEPLPPGQDLICANLPYLAEGSELPSEVTAQPASALYGGPRGSELILKFLGQVPARLAPHGAVLAEIDPPIADEVSAAGERLLGAVRVHKDLGGQIRLLEAWRPSG